jgi:hypothetical protein
MQEGRKKNRRKLCSCFPALLFKLSYFEQNFIPGIQGIELALCEGPGDVEL